MNFKRIGNKKEEILFNVINQDITTIGGAGIAPGVPLVLLEAGPAITNQLGGDGLGVVLPSNAPGGAAQVQGAFYGVNTQQLAYSVQGNSMVVGYYPSAVVVLQTRAATTNTWASTALTPWAQLSIDTVNNAFTPGATNSNPFYVPSALLLGAITQTGTAATATATTNTNTMATLASNASDTRTVITMACRVQISNL